MRGRSQHTLELVAAAQQILEEIQPATVRVVCYQLFIRKLIPDMSRSSTAAISRILTCAREEGEIPWGHIVDESREAETVQQWSNPAEIIRATVRGYRRDYWQDQDCRVEVWSEKGTVRGTLGPVLEEYGVTFRVMHGYASSTVINEIAEMSISSDKPLVALYVGDWDPSGKHMSDVDLPRRLEEYGAELSIKRIALTQRDLRGLPSFNVKTKCKDPRYARFRKSTGSSCYELDAMPPPDLRARVLKEIHSYIDLDMWRHACKIEAVEVESMESFHKAWIAIQAKST